MKILRLGLIIGLLFPWRVPSKNSIFEKKEVILPKITPIVTPPLAPKAIHFANNKLNIGDLHLNVSVNDSLLALDNDTTLLAKTMNVESRYDYADGLCVAQVIRNRMRKMQKSLREIVLMPKQFSGNPFPGHKPHGNWKLHIGDIVDVNNYKIASAFLRNLIPSTMLVAEDALLFINPKFDAISFVSFCNTKKQLVHVSANNHHYYK